MVFAQTVIDKYQYQCATFSHCSNFGYPSVVNVLDYVINSVWRACTQAEHRGGHGDLLSKC